MVRWGRWCTGVGFALVLVAFAARMTFEADDSVRSLALAGFALFVAGCAMLTLAHRRQDQMRAQLEADRGRSGSETGL